MTDHPSDAQRPRWRLRYDTQHPRSETGWAVYTPCSTQEEAEALAESMNADADAALREAVDLLRRLSHFKLEEDRFICPSCLWEDEGYAEGHYSDCELKAFLLAALRSPATGEAEE